MRLVAVRVEVPSNSPVVLLQEVDDEERMLPIFIAPLEATSICFALEGVESERPLTHDLVCEMLHQIGARVTRVEITGVLNDTYYAELFLNSARGEVRISARPSDAIAIALRAGAPIYAADDVVASNSVVVAVLEEDPDALIEEFQSFVQNVRPEDFA